ncbi:MAG TPA: R3H domain-containing nucleic acid-binding protein [Thermoanaerobaculia bacterium]|nr:R3H domain-containing nucleic acid-binding protein [Thermoanaerobaculia bacterium]
MMNGEISGGEAEVDMNDSKRRFFSGDTLQQALVQAANHYHLQPEEIAYHQIEKRHGFTKVRRKFVIEIDPAAPRREAGAAPPPKAPAQAAERTAGPALPVTRAAPAAPAGSSAGAPAPVAGPADRGTAPGRRPQPAQSAAPANAGMGGRSTGHHGGPGGRRGQGEHRGGPRRPSGAYPREPRHGDLGMSGTGRPAMPEADLVTLPEMPRKIGERYPAAQGPQAEAAAKGVELLLRVAGLSLTPHIYQGEERLEIDLVGTDVDWCFADDGELLMAIEHLLPRIIRSLSGEAVLCRVDCDNFHEIREERLRSLAQKAADEVRQRGRSRTLVPMNPADRRIIHVTLADDPAVVTESEGEGYFKRITVRPA